MFFLSKIVAFLLDPALWVIAMLTIAVAWPGLQSQVRRRASALALTLLCCIGFEALPEQGIRALEAQYAEIAPDAPLTGFVGAIVLGGATESGAMAMSHVQPGLNDAAERMTAALALAQRHPKLAIIFTGGEGNPLGKGPSEAARARAFFEAMGLTAERVRYESVSRNTFENAVLTAQLPGIDPNQRWLLITSAWHMHRAMATFQKAGWNVVAYPVDFRTASDTDWFRFNIAASDAKWSLLLRELVGSAAYRLSGRL